jgi:hypothetical protein
MMGHARTYRDIDVNVGACREYRGIQGNTREYKGIHRNTLEYGGIKCNIGEYSIREDVFIREMKLDLGKLR